MGLYQDNISTQLLIKNGKMSSGKRNKHIKAKFFFIKDRVDDGEMKVLGCPTKEMWADIMTKPLQGAAFRIMRDELMNCDVNYEDLSEEEESESVLSPKTVSWKSIVLTTFKTPQECVGQNRNPGVLWLSDTRNPHGILGETSEWQGSELRQRRKKGENENKSKSSLILDYLTIQCHAFSVRIDVFSTGGERWQLGRSAAEVANMNKG